MLGSVAIKIGDAGVFDYSGIDFLNALHDVVINFVAMEVGADMVG